MRPLRVAWLGRARYQPVWQLQERLRDGVLAGAADECLLLLEHEPVITLGRRADPRHVLVEEERLAAAGVERVTSSRGGDVTYHGPGQLVAYPVVRLERGVVAHVEALAAGVVDVAAGLGIDARFRRDCPGVWAGERKLCAFGIHVHRRVAIHGLALNVTTSLEPFTWIVPCGLRGAAPTSLAELCSGAPPSVAELAGPLATAIARHLGRSARFDDGAAAGFVRDAAFRALLS